MNESVVCHTHQTPLGQAISRMIPVSGVCGIHHYLLLSFHRPINVFVEQLLCTWWTVAHIHHTHTHWCQRQTVLNDSMNNSSTRSRPLVHWQISSPSLYASWYQALNILSSFQTGHFRLNEGAFHTRHVGKWYRQTGTFCHHQILILVTT